MSLNAQISDGPEFVELEDRKRRALRGPPPCGAVRRCLLSVMLCLLWPIGARTQEPQDPNCTHLDRTWPSGVLEFYFGANLPEELAGSIEDQESVVRCAAAVWEDQTRADIDLRYLGRTEVPPDILDDINSISWSGADGGDAFAVTFWQGDVPEQITSIEILIHESADGVPIQWTTHGKPESLEIDLQGVLVHEIGHALGLGHFEDQLSTMFPSVRLRGLALRTLNESDVSCIESRYGQLAGPVPTVELSSATPYSIPNADPPEVVLTGKNFTYQRDTTIHVGTQTIDPSQVLVESCDRIRILNMPAHTPGIVDLLIENGVGSATLVGALEFTGELPFVRGDANSDGATDLSDAIHILTALFLGGAPLDCEAAADTNSDTRLDLSDGVYLLSHLFLGQPAPQAPLDCSELPAPQQLPCEAFPACHP